LLPLFVLAHCAHHLLTALPVPLLPFIRNDFNLDYTGAGLVISAFQLSYGISQLPAGWLADRIGPRILITIGTAGVALAGLLVGISPTYIMLLVFMVILGAAGGGYHPATPPIISASVEPKRRGLALGLHLIGGNTSFFLTPLIAAGIATAWGWRGPFLALAPPILIFGIAFYVLLGRRANAPKAGHGTTTSTESQTPDTPGRLRHLVSFIALSTFNHAVVISVISFIPLYLVDHFGTGEATGAAFLAVLYSSGLWASPLGGYLSDRLGAVPVLLVVCLATGPLIYLLNLAPYGLGIAALLVVMGMVPGIRMPASEAYIIGNTAARRRSTVLGIYFFASIEGGGLLTPVMGYLIDRFGFHFSFSMAGAVLLTATLVGAMFLRGSRDRPTAE